MCWMWPSQDTSLTVCNSFHIISNARKLLAMRWLRWEYLHLVNLGVIILLCFLFPAFLLSYFLLSSLSSCLCFSILESWLLNIYQHITALLVRYFSIKLYMKTHETRKHYNLSTLSMGLKVCTSSRFIVGFL